MGCTCPGGPRGVPRAAGGRPPPPLPSLPRRLFVPLPRLLQSEPPWQRAWVPWSRPSRRVAVSSSTSGAPAAGERVPLPLPPIACDLQPARLRGRVSPSRPVPRGAGAWPRVSPSRRRRERGAARERKELRSGPGSLPAAAREGPAAGVGCATPLWGWAPPALPRCLVRGRRCRCRCCHAATVASVMPLPRVGAVKEPGRSGLAERAGGPGARACTAGGGYLVDPASSICLSQSLSHACLSTHGRYSETANGSLNQLWFLWSLLSHSLDNCGNSRANTCRRAPTSGDACIYQTKTNPGPPGSFGDSR